MLVENPLGFFLDGPVGQSLQFFLRREQNFEPHRGQSDLYTHSTFWAWVGFTGDLRAKALDQEMKKCERQCGKRASK